VLGLWGPEARTGGNGAHYLTFAQTPSGALSSTTSDGNAFSSYMAGFGSSIHDHSEWSIDCCDHTGFSSSR
jgi:hypothetical protein